MVMNDDDTCNSVVKDTDGGSLGLIVLELDLGLYREWDLDPNYGL